jgi:invasion protein IalB
VFCVVALAGGGYAWSHISELILKSEVRELAARETARSPDGWAGIGAWKLICEGSSCRAEASLGSREDSLRMSARVAGRDTGRALILEVSVPLGVELAQGLTIRVRNDETVHAAFARCELRGCIATFFPELYLMTAFRHADTIDFRYSVADTDAAISSDRPARESVQVRFPMQGFAAAVSRLR